MYINEFLQKIATGNKQIRLNLSRLTMINIGDVVFTINFPATHTDSINLRYITNQLNPLEVVSLLTLQEFCSDLFISCKSEFAFL